MSTKRKSPAKRPAAPNREPRPTKASQADKPEHGHVRSDGEWVSFPEPADPTTQHGAN